ncbi:MAG: hypothetical protein WBW32_12830 [Luteibacter sp.]
MLHGVELRHKRSEVANAWEMFNRAQRDNDFFELIQWTGWPERLEAELRAFEAVPHDIGEVGLDFAGGACHGMFGVDLALANRAIDGYIRLLECQAASLNTRSDAGREKWSYLPPLQLTVTVSEPFGFILREKKSPGTGPSFVPEAIHGIAVAIAALVADSYASSRTESRSDDPILVELNAFLGILDEVGASLHIVEGESKHDFSVADIHGACVRSANTLAGW